MKEGQETRSQLGTCTPSPEAKIGDGKCRARLGSIANTEHSVLGQDPSQALMLPSDQLDSRALTSLPTILISPALLGSSRATGHTHLGTIETKN